MEATMTRMIFAAVAALAGVFIGPQPAEARAPWCAVINLGTGSVYWGCQYRSFEDCYHRGVVLAGNRGFCHPSPYYVTGYVEARPSLGGPASPQEWHERA